MSIDHIFGGQVTKAENIKADTRKILRPTSFWDRKDITADTLWGKKDIKADSIILVNKANINAIKCFLFQSEPSRSSCIILQLITVFDLNILRIVFKELYYLKNKGQQT